MVGRTYHLLPAEDGAWSVLISKGGLKEHLRAGSDRASLFEPDGKGSWRLSSSVARTLLAERIRLDLGHGPVRDSLANRLVDELSEALDFPTAISIEASQLHRFFRGARPLHGVVQPVTLAEHQRLEAEPRDASTVRALTAEEVHARMIGKVIVISRWPTPGTGRSKEFSLVARVEQGGQFSSLINDRNPNCRYGSEGWTYLAGEGGARASATMGGSQLLCRLMAENMSGHGSDWLESSLRRNLQAMIDSLEPGEAIRLDVAPFVASERSQRQFDPKLLAPVVPFTPVPTPDAGSMGLA